MDITNLNSLGKQIADAQSSPPAVREPEAGDVDRFQEALNRPPAQETPPPEAPVDSVAPASMGERILQGLGKVSDKVKADQAEAVGVLGKENVTQADLLRANFALLESTTVVSAVGKTAEKLNQGIKTLQQG